MDFRPQRSGIEPAKFARAPATTGPFLAEDQFGRPLQFTLGTADDPFQLNIPAGEAVGAAYLGIQNVLGSGAVTPEQLWAGLGTDPANVNGFVNTMRVRWAEAMAAAFGDENVAAQIFENQLQVDAAAAGEQQADTGGQFDLAAMGPEGLIADIAGRAGFSDEDILRMLAPDFFAQQETPDADEEFFLDPNLGNQPFGF